MKNGVKTEIVILNPTLKLSLENIKRRAQETGRDVIKSEVVEKYADMYSNIEKLFGYLKSNFPELQTSKYPISFQIYNKSSNLPEDLSVSYNINDLQHGSRQEISEEYDLIIKQLNSPSLENDNGRTV